MFSYLSEKQKEIIIDTVAETLGDDVFVCTRVWSAWSHGTMNENDFDLAAEDDDIVHDIAEILYNKIVEVQNQKLPGE